MPGQDIYRCASVQEVKYHLWSDFFRKGGNAFFCNTVVTGEGKDQLPVDYGQPVFGNSHQSPGKLLKPAEAPRGLGEIIKPLLCLFHELIAGVHNTFQRFLHRSSPLIFIGIPATVIYTSSAIAATFWFNIPAASLNLRASSLSATMPAPTSLATIVNRAALSDARDAMSFSVSLPISKPAVITLASHNVRQLNR